MKNRLSRLPSMPLAAAGLLLAVVLGATLAPSSAPAQNRAEGEAACMDDVMSLCSEFVPDERRIAACLRKQRLKLSPACRAAMSGKSKRRRQPRRG